MISEERRRIPLLELIEEHLPALGPEDAYAAVLCGEIFVDGERIRNPKNPVPSDAKLRYTPRRFVGRGGDKLDAALSELKLEPAGRVCLDAGASTGGFTDCLLSRGALSVHAVDVGRNQLAWKIRSHPRVHVRERTNIMDIRPGDLHPPPSFAVADLSFRSLRRAAARLLQLTAGLPVLALAKPQFERPPEDGFNGVVRSPRARTAALESLRRDLIDEQVWVCDACPSILPGAAGNREIFLLLSAAPPPDKQYAQARLKAALDRLASPAIPTDKLLDTCR